MHVAARHLARQAYHNNRNIIISITRPTFMYIRVLQSEHLIQIGLSMYRIKERSGGKVVRCFAV